MKFPALLCLASLLTVQPALSQQQAAPAAQTQAAPPPAAASEPQAQPKPAEVLPAPPQDGKLRVYVTDNPVDITTYSSVGRGATVANSHTAVAVGTQAGSTSRTTEDPRTVEIQADIQKLCPANVIVTSDMTRADFLLMFRRREGARSLGFAGGGLIGLAALSGAKVDGASLFDRTGDMVFATKQNTVEKAIRDICAHVK
jgi:hypothetical protein